MNASRGILSTAAILVVAMIFGAALTAPAGAARKADTPSTFVAASPDGEQVLFQTDDRLDPRDRDNEPDIYENRGGRTRLVSITPEGAVSKGAINVSFHSETEARALLTTNVSFSPEDQDDLYDIYEISGDRLTLLSQDSLFPSDCVSACTFAVASTAADGRIIYFSSEFALTAEDNDRSVDFFSLTNGQVELITGGPLAGGADTKGITNWVRQTEDGSAVYFQTDEPLVPEDSDLTFDGYVHSATGTTLVTPWPAAENSSTDQMDVQPSKVVPGRFVIYTTESFAGTPVDAGLHKTYLVDGGQRTLIASGEQRTQLAGESPDGQTVYFASDDALTAADTDPSPDLYGWRAGQFELVSIGPRGSVATSDTKEVEVVKVTTNGDVYFKTSDQLVGSDNNDEIDLYIKSVAGDLRLLSVDQDGKATSEGISGADVLDDGLRVIIISSGQLTRNDRHFGPDMFVLEGGALRLITRPASAQNYTNGDIPSLGAHRGTDRYLITNGYRLTSDDGDEVSDVYRIDLSDPKPVRLLSASDLRILSGPARYVRLGPVTFTFGQAGAKPRFRCSMDEGKPRPCRSPITYRSLSPDQHRFQVVSTGPGGLGEDLPAVRSFQVLSPERPAKPRRAELHAVSAGGRRVLIESSDRLARADRDDTRDLFIRGVTGRTTLVTRGPGYFSDPYDVSSDLERMIFRSSGPLVAADRDEASDLYMWNSGKVSLLPAGVDVSDTSRFAGVSENGRAVAFTTRDSLDPRDTDQADDLYRASPSGVSLISGGVAAGADVIPAGSSADGSSFLFLTSEALVPEDIDGGSTLYWAAKGQMLPISPGGTFKKSGLDPRVVGMARNGSTVILSSKRRLVETDTDDFTDIYSWTNGIFDLVSTGPESESEKFGATVPRRANWGSYVESDWEGLSQFDSVISNDASQIVFRTSEQLVFDDRDRAQDVYVYRDGSAKLVDPRKGGRDSFSFRGSSADLKSVIVQTEDALVASDRNADDDLYRVTGKRAERLTAGPRSEGYRGFRVLWVSKNGREVAFQTAVKLTKEDRDVNQDLYLSTAGRPTLLSKYKTTKVRDKIRSFLASDRGGSFYISTRARLVKADKDDVDDVYRLGRGAPVKVS